MDQPFYANPYLLTTVRWLIGLMFILSGAAKLQDPKGFTMAVYNFRVLPNALVELYATLIPYVELAAGVLLVIGLFAQPAALVAALTLLSFTLAIGWNLRRGERPDCHCFGNLFSEELSGVLVVRNTILMAVLLPVILAPSTYFAMQSVLWPAQYPAANLPWVDVLPCFFLALAGIAAVLLTGQVSATISRSPWVESPWPSLSLRRKR